MGSISGQWPHLANKTITASLLPPIISEHGCMRGMDRNGRRGYVGTVNIGRIGMYGNARKWSTIPRCMMNRMVHSKKWGKR